MAFAIKENSTGGLMELYILQGGLEYTDDEGVDHYINDEVMIEASSEWYSLFNTYEEALDKLQRRCRASEGNYVINDYEIVEV